MKGLVYRIDDGVYLSLIDDGVAYDGIPISEGVYTSLQDNHISIVDVNVKDGTMILDIDVKSLIEKASEKSGDLFYEIKDLSLFSFNASIKQIVEQGEFQTIVKELLENEKG